MNISGIGNRIISLREQKHWSQRELAKRVGINASVMNRIELEERPIKDYELDILASILNTTTDYLLGRELNEDKAVYSSPESMKQIIYLLGIKDLPLNIMKDLHHIKPEDRDDIKKYIEYILYKAKKRDNHKGD